MEGQIPESGENLREVELENKIATLIEEKEALELQVGIKLICVFYCGLFSINRVHALFSRTCFFHVGYTKL